VLDVGRKHPLEVTSAQQHGAIEALCPYRADPSFGIGVRLGGSPGRSDDLDALRFEDLVERRSEALVTVVDEEADRFDRSSRAAERLRAIWVHQARLAGPSVTPPISTRRVCRSMKKSTCSVLSRIDSTVNRSQAMIEEAWVRMNWRQVSRLGPGRDLTARIRRMLVVEISMPIFWSSPWIRL
jgi:hypothetical protein